MSLKEYQKKRDFAKTPEPKGKVTKKSQNRFVVQKHQASHLHYDFRLELPDKIDGKEIVLKSWAVPKGIPEKAGVKRLAIQTEDHVVEYLNFHGIVPEGQYGAGKVEIFDKGKFKLQERTKNSLKFILQGRKLKGSYSLFHPPTFEKDQWLITKHKKSLLTKKIDKKF